MKIVTHNAKFHTDDVFAVATLFLVLGKDNCEVIRTRDEDQFISGDYVIDVGSVYNAEENRFDHHQAGGAGERENGIPYASFGLVWKKFGEELCGSKKVFESIDRSLVQPVDASDNGKDICMPLVSNITQFTIGSLVNQYRLTWTETGNWDEKFLECVDWATSVLTRYIKITKDSEEAKEIVEGVYSQSQDKEIIIMNEDQDVGREVVQDVLVSFPEPIYAVIYRSDVRQWQVAAIKKGFGTYELRKRLPESWGAKQKQELEKITGIPGSIFCHRKGFMCLAETKDAALALAKIALEN